MQKNLPEGIYERLLDDELGALIDSQPELRVLLCQIDDEMAPGLYAQFVGQLLQQALRIVPADARIPLLNRLIELLAAQDGLDYLHRRRLLGKEKALLTEVRLNSEKSLRPVTPLNSSS